MCCSLFCFQAVQTGIGNSIKIRKPAGLVRQCLHPAPCVREINAMLGDAACHFAELGATLRMPPCRLEGAANPSPVPLHHA
jgi:hypothetical protein